MFGRKKKKEDMIDIRKLRKGSVVNLPKKDIMVPQNKDGFVEVGTNSTVSTPTTSTSTNSSPDNANFFGFMDSNTEQTSSDSFSTQTDGYNKREVDAKITELDNKIYRLEQRLELAEKKLDINNNDSNVGPAGW